MNEVSQAFRKREPECPFLNSLKIKFVYSFVPSFFRLFVRVVVLFPRVQACLDVDFVDEATLVLVELSMPHLNI